MNQSEEKDKDYHKAIKNVVEHLKSKRSELNDEIKYDEQEKSHLLGEMNKIQDKLSIIDANLRKKSEFRKEYDKAITQSEENFVELLRKSEDFLALTRREVLALSHAVCEAPGVCKEQRREHEHKPKPKPPPGPKPPPPLNSPAAIFAFEQIDKPEEMPQAEKPRTVSMPMPPMEQPVPPTPKCPGCPPVGNCTTILIPYRANGL